MLTEVKGACMTILLPLAGRGIFDVTGQATDQTTDQLIEN